MSFPTGECGGVVSVNLDFCKKLFIESLEMQKNISILIKKIFKLESLPKIINGNVSGKIRQKIVDDFQRKGRCFDVIILSPKAGGVGLTLTAANHVIHLSRWWNPAVEDQCTDRVYRIGQNASLVNVYYPMAVHPIMGDSSFDVRLNEFLERKRMLSREVLLPQAISEHEQKSFFDDIISS